LSECSICVLDTACPRAATALESPDAVSRDAHERNGKDVMRLSERLADKIPFDFKLVARALFKSIFATRGTDARLTFKRILVILFIFPGSALLGLAHLIGFTLDNIFFRDYRSIEVQEPVFVTGVFRTGTTLMHRLLTKDEKRFTTIKLWEIFFGPSIVEKKMWLAIGALDRKLLGGLFHRRVVKRQDQLFEKARQIHTIDLFEPEEDEGILLNLFDSFFQFFVFPFPEERRPFERFDTELPHSARMRIMNFYKRCVQRHLYVFGKDKQFLSKNPTFSPRVQTLREIFPDAKFVYTVRSPLQTVPSLLSMFYVLEGFLCSPIEPSPMQEPTLDMIGHWYRYPVEQLESWPEECRQIVKYDDFVKDPGRTIVELYERFGFEVSEEYRRILDEGTRKARAYRSKHVYSLEQFGLTREELVNRYADVFERFGFDAD